MAGGFGSLKLRANAELGDPRETASEAALTGKGQTNRTPPEPVRQVRASSPEEPTEFDSNSTSLISEDSTQPVVSISCSDLKEVLDKNPMIRVKILEKLVLLLRDRIGTSYRAIESL